MKFSARVRATAAFCAFSVTAVPLPARAETVAYAVPASTTGADTFSGALGMDFDVTVPIYVYALGVFDSGSNGLSRAITARIFNRATQTEIASITFAAGMTGTLVDGSRFVSLPCPLTLPAGFQGVIVAEGYGAGENNGSSNTGAWTTGGDASALAFVGTSRYGNAGAFPTTTDTRVNKYAAGTFAFARACATTSDCTNPARPVCGEGGVCGAAIGAFFPACTGVSASCDFARGTCIGCRRPEAGALTGRCPSPTASACKSTGECVECNGPLECTATKPVCMANACRTCGHDYGFGTTAGDACPATSPVCAPSGRCSRCASDDDCIGHVVTACNLVTGACGDPPCEGCDAGTSGEGNGGDSGVMSADAGENAAVVSGSSSGCTTAGSPIPRALAWAAACCTIAWLFRRKREPAQA